MGGLLLEIEAGALDEIVERLGGQVGSGPDAVGDGEDFLGIEQAGLVDFLKGLLAEPGAVAPVGEEGLPGGLLGWKGSGGMVDGPVEVAGDLVGFLAGGEDPGFVVGDAGEVVLFGPADAGAGGGPVNVGDDLGQEEPGGAVAGLFQGAAEEHIAFLGVDDELGEVGGGGEAEVADGSLEVVAELSFPIAVRGDADALGGFVPGLGIDGVEQGGILGLLGSKVLEPEVFGEDGVLAGGEVGAGGGR